MWAQNLIWTLSHSALLLLALTLIVLSIPGLLSSEDIREGEGRGTNNISRQKFISLPALTATSRFGKINTWILWLSRLSLTDLQGYKEVLLLQRAYWQMILSLQMTKTQTGQEQPIWGWKLCFQQFSVMCFHGMKEQLQTTCTAKHVRWTSMSSC